MSRRAEPVIASAAIDEALALLDAVVAGELLVALPPQAIDRERHNAGVRLIELARDRLAAAERSCEHQLEHRRTEARESLPAPR